MANFRRRKALLSIMTALVAADCAGTFSAFVFAAFAEGSHGLGLPGSLVMGVFASLVASPFVLLMIWKVAIIAIIVGEALGRSIFYYLLAGVIAVHWMDYSVLDINIQNSFAINAIGAIAGYIFWLVRTRCDFSD